MQQFYPSNRLFFIGEFPTVASLPGGTPVGYSAYVQDVADEGYYGSNNSGGWDFLGGSGSAGGALSLTGDATGSGSIPGSIALTIPANTVTNAKSAQMAANTVKANITGSSANASDVTLSSFKTWLSFGTISANQMLFTNGSNVITGSANYTVNGTGGLTIAQTLTATGGAFAAGVSGFNITGTNAACNIGTNFNLAQAGSSGAFFSGTVSGDTIIRQTNTGLSIYLGVGSTTPQLQVANTAVNFRVNPSIISTTNPALNIASNTNFAQVTGAGNFFSNAAVGDTVIRQTDTSKAIRLGVTVSGSSGLDITNTGIVANLPISGASSLFISTTGTFLGNLSALNMSTGGITLATTGATAAPLNYNEENVAHNLTMSTPDGTNHDLALTVTRIGKVVTIMWDSLSVTATAAAAFVSTVGLPTKWRPITTLGIRDFNIVNDNSVPVPGMVSIEQTGVVAFYVGVNQGNFTASGSATIYPNSATFLTA